MGRGVGTGVVEFRVLGPVEVWRDGHPLRLSGERQRVLLALLVLHANELVMTDQLVDKMFGGGRVDGGVNAVHAAVSRLRRVLEGSDDAVALATRPGGYVLNTPADHVDAALFERLSTEGRRLLAADNAEAAAACLQDGLGLWRGPPLADLTSVDCLQSEIRRLEELRLAATMDRIDADLRLGRDSSLVPELEGLVAGNPLQERLRGQLMVALYRAGRQAEALDVYRRTSELLRDELGLDPSPQLQELERQVLRQDPALGCRRPSAPGPAARARMPVVCPFKGLAAFDRSDAEYFCGRDRVVSDVLARLAESTLVGIVGPSGVGKSSLLRAGLLAALSDGALPGSAGWRQVLVRPGEHPCAELARALGGLDVDGLFADVSLEERVVIAVDQLEELFTVCEAEEERAAFLDQLAAVARDAERRVLVTVSVRADFYGRFAAYAGFARLLSTSHVLVGPMGREELSEAIELPSARAGLEVEPRLVQRLVADVAGEPGGLPLLSTTLLELWRMRDGRVLRSDSYVEIGGVRSAVARLAENAFTGLGKGERQVARVVLLRLATGDEGALVRRRVPIANFARMAGAPAVIDALADARLLTISEGEVEVSHEALLHEWPRYRAWLEEDRTGRQLQARLGSAARAWEAGGRDTGDLYRGARLTAALDWSAHRRDELSPLEEEFLQASRRATDRAARWLRGTLAGVALLLVVSLIAGVIALVQKQHATSAARRAVAQQLGAQAVITPRIDLAMLLARESVNLDPTPQTESTLLATLLRSPTAIASFELPLGVRPLSLTLSPNGRTLLVGANDNDLYSYDPATRNQDRPPLTDFSADPWPVYSADGSLLLLSDNGNPPGIEVLDAHSLRRLARLRFDRRWLSVPTVDSFPGSLAVSRNRRTAYYGYAVVGPSGAPGPGYVDRWTLPSGRLTASTRVTPSGFLGMRLLDRGDRLVVLGSSTVQTLSAGTLRPQRTVAVKLPVQSLPAAVSPDGSTAALGTGDGSISFVNLSTGAIRAGVGGHTATVQSLEYSPDGRVLVSTADDEKVIVWDPRTAQPLDVLTGHAGRPTGIAFAADGRTLYTSSLDGTVLTWDLGSGRRFGRLFRVGPGLALGPLSSGAPPLAVSADGARFATRTDADRVGIFATRTLRQQASFAVPHAGVVRSLAWSPQGSSVAVGGNSGIVELWQVSRAPRALRILPNAHAPGGPSDIVQSVAFSPDGRLLAATDVSQVSGQAPPTGRVVIWHTATAAPVNSPLALGASGNQLAFSPNGRLLAAALGDGRALTIDAATGRPMRTLHPYEGSNGGTVSVAFAPDGTLATGDYAGLVQLWNPNTGEGIGHPLLVNAAPVASIAFDPSGARFATTGGPEGGLKLWFTSSLQQDGVTLDPEQASYGTAAFADGGRALLSIDSDGRASIWPAALSEWERHACAVAGRNLTHEEWSRFVSGYNYRPACP